MKRTGMVVSILLIAVVAVAIGYWGWSKKAEQAAPVVEAQKSTVMVVNVLDKALYDDAHIKGSIQVDAAKLGEESDKWNKDATIVFYCSNTMCMTSAEAAKMLTDKGFTNVSAYEGGMAEWFQLSKTNPEYVVEGPAQSEYLTMLMQPKPAEEAAAAVPAVKKITAEELLNLMKSANLLA